MDTKKVFWLSFSILLLLCSAADADPAARTREFLRAVASDDFKSQFALDLVSQRRVEAIQQSNPKVLWPQLTDEIFASFETRRRTIDDPEPFQTLLRFQPTTTILEVRLKAGRTLEGRLIDTVYVNLEYKDPLNSPINSYAEGFVKKAILEVTLDSKTGLVQAASVVPKSVVLWQAAQPRIISVQYQPTRELTVYPLGGKPPFNAAMQCGESTADAVSHEFKPMFGGAFNEITLPEPTTAGQCTITVTDATGLRDAVRFDLKSEKVSMLSRLMVQYWYGREPWFSKGPRTQLFFKGGQGGRVLPLSDVAELKAD